ncbi:hypothetical protein ACGIF2_01435 [Cellulomonas sp. P22]|uniref:hypothetical protein n=1 Tax=Cellulomonas sp. P22 TaxID=3373189 RepID=UPI00378B0FE0
MRSPDVEDLVSAYLDQLAASPATVRQRRWALRDLADFAASSPGGRDARAALEPQALGDWLADRAGGSTVATQRARASAARALVEFARKRRLVPDLDVPGKVLALPTPPPADRDADRGRRLLAATSHGAPRAVPPAIWARFTAHVHLLAAVGQREDELARLRVSDVQGDLGLVRAPSDAARRALQGWLEVRADAVSRLQGSDPGALWVRLHAAVDRRTGLTVPAGLAISRRGLRLSFATVRDALAAQGHPVADVTVRDVRAVARP